MQTHKVMVYKNDEWRQVGAVELDDTGRSILVLTEVAKGRLLLHPITQVQAVPTQHKYDDPPIDFDDDIPF